MNNRVQWRRGRNGILWNIGKWRSYCEELLNDNVGKKEINKGIEKPYGRIRTDVGKYHQKLKSKKSQEIAIATKIVTAIRENGSKIFHAICQWCNAGYWSEECVKLILI